jgi:hypothetical protein
VNSNGVWTAVTEDAVNNRWCSPSYPTSSGTNDGTVNVIVVHNPFLATRTATVKITLGNLTKFVVVNQEAAEKPKEFDCSQVADCWDFPETGFSWQIPDSILSCLSTECLANICWQYPNLLGFSAYRHWYRNTQWLFNEFNGNVELIRREGALMELVKIYEYQVQKISSMDERFRVESLEWLLSFFVQTVDVTRDDLVKVLRGLVSGPDDTTRGSGVNLYARAQIILRIGSEGLEGELLKDWQTLYNNEIESGFVAGRYWQEINRLSYELIK